MRVLIDTNILIHREDFKITNKELADFTRLASEKAICIMVHPLTVEEIKKDKDAKRRGITLSKIKAYSLLEPPNIDQDDLFLDLVGHARKTNDYIDNSLIYCVMKNAVDFLVTEDSNIHRKAIKIGLSDRVFGIKEAYAYLDRLYKPFEVLTPSSVQEVPIHNLNLDDPIFDSLKKDYYGFSDWWNRISRSGRRAWIYWKDKDHLGTILILKHENEAVASIPPLPKKERVKLCTFKVDYPGHRLGELFMKLAINYCVSCGADEVYLTHYTSDEDPLLALINEYGFRELGKYDGESLFLKKLRPDVYVQKEQDIARIFFPSFYDGDKVAKYVVPIKPTYSDRLFIDLPGRKETLFEAAGKLPVEGNTIKKAYVCRSHIAKMEPGDILLFYRSHKEQALISLGTIDSFLATNDPDEAIRMIGNRTVYTRDEIEKMTANARKIKVILFRHHLYLKPFANLNYLKAESIISAAPQQIMSLPHSNYMKLIKGGFINDSFTVH